MFPEQSNTVSLTRLAKLIAMAVERCIIQGESYEIQNGSEDGNDNNDDDDDGDYHYLSYDDNNDIREDQTKSKVLMRNSKE